jgi:hypothetical protein
MTEPHTIAALRQLQQLDEEARAATTTLRDFARMHGMHFRDRDPLVMAIHDALDAYRLALDRAARPLSQE